MGGIKRERKKRGECGAERVFMLPENEAREVVLAVRSKVGRKYKTAIHDAWLSGDYAGECLSEFASELQRIRNTYGPTWLVNFRP